MTRVLYSHWIFKLPFMDRYYGMVLGRTILFKYEESQINPIMLKHEMIHQEQMDRVGVIPFYLIYLKDFVKNLWACRNWDQAYLNIPFEVEAYDRQSEK